MADIDEPYPEWLAELFDAVAGCFEAESSMGPLAMHFSEEKGVCKVCISPTPIELVGEPGDEALVAPWFTLDLERLRSNFDAIAALGWNTDGLNVTGGCPHVFVEGVFQRRNVFLQILACAPDVEEPGIVQYYHE